MGEALNLVAGDHELSRDNMTGGDAMAEGNNPIGTVITPDREEDWQPAPQQGGRERKRKLISLTSSPPLSNNNRFEILSIEESNEDPRQSEETALKKIDRRQSSERSNQINAARSELPPQQQPDVQPEQEAQEQRPEQEQQVQELPHQQVERQQQPLQQEGEQQQERQPGQQQPKLRQEQQEQLEEEKQKQQQHSTQQQQQAELQQQQPPVKPQEQEEQHLEQQQEQQQELQSSPRFSASQPTMSIGVRPVVHNDKTKSQWSLTVKPQTKTVVIADSNFRLATHLPADWEVHVYPGMNLIQTNNVILASNINTSKNIQHVVVSSGMNNRGWSFNNVLTDINKVHSSLEKLRCTGHFVGISTPPEIPETEKETINKINNHARHRFNKNYIQPLPLNEVSVSPNDKFKIHYDHFTVEKICSGIVNHFLCLTGFLPKPGRLSL